MDGRAVVLDASVWISRLSHQDVYHNVSTIWVQRFIALGGILAVPSFFLVEVAGAISRLTGQPALSRGAIEDLNRNYEMHIVHLDALLVQATIDVATDLQLRAGDATYVAVAHQLHIPLVSWDKEQLQRAGRLIATYTPDEYTF